MKIKFGQGFVLVLLAVIFTVGLTFASVELPRLLDKVLHKNIDFLDVATGQSELTAYKTDLFLSHFKLRLLGYISLAIVLGLIIIGFIMEKKGIASVGAIILFLPVFGHFAATMFFLGGLGFLRLIWLPFFDVSFDVMRLGDIVLLPYRFLIDIFSWVGINIWRELPYIITGLGLFLFLVGVLTWFYGRLKGESVADFWIYKISRHPQYLGWIIWSYGVLFLPGPNIKQYVGVGNSLPWLLATMLIIGIALLEERQMKKKYGDSYESYRKKTPFLFPIPRFLEKIFALPLKIIFKKEYPERKREIATVISFYTILFVFLSVFYTGIIELPFKKSVISRQNIGELVKTVKMTDNRNEIRKNANLLAESGKPEAVDSLVALLKHENYIVRWYCADALSRVKSEKVVSSLIFLLDDPEIFVRRAAVSSLGEIGLNSAIEPLIDVLADPNSKVQSYAARALGKMGAVEAVQPLIKNLKSENPVTVSWSAWALGEIGEKEAVEPLIDCFEKRKNCDYYLVGAALKNLDSEKAEDAFILGLKDDRWWIQASCAEELGKIKSEKSIRALLTALKEGNKYVRRASVLALDGVKSKQVVDALNNSLSDEDFEVRIYAKEVLKKLKKK